MDGNGECVGGITFDAGIDVGSQSWLHSVFACPLHKDECVVVTEFAKTTNLVQCGISVPGSADEERKVSRSHPCLLRLLRQWYGVMWRLRRAGFTLRGNFSCENFLVYRPKQQQQARKRKRGACSQHQQLRIPDRASDDMLEVRMTGRVQLSIYSREDAAVDDGTFVWSVREVLNIRHQGQVPVDIAQWLDLINERGVGNEYLVRYHISLMDPRAGFSVLMSLRRRIDFLMRRNKDVYRRVLNAMPQFQDWDLQHQNFKNRFMEATQNFILNQGGEAQKKDGFVMQATRQFILSQSGETQQKKDGFVDPNVGLGGALKVIRDCSEHQAKRFELYMMLILQEDFTDLVAPLYLVMFRVGQLLYLHLEGTMA